MKINKIVILCGYDFPQGMAATTRILSYCKGFYENDIDVEIFSYAWRCNDSMNPEKGEIDGIKYFYSHSWKKSSSWLYKNIVDRFLIVTETIKKILLSNKKRKIDYLFLSFDDVGRMLEFVPLLRLLGVRMVFIHDEFPEPMRNKLVSSIPWWKKTIFRLIFTFISGKVLMTYPLKDFYDKISPSPTFIFPSIIDINRFGGILDPVSRERENYICYTGALEFTSDNIDYIIHAFSVASKIYPDLELRLYGAPSEENETKVLKILQNEKCQKRVRLMGRVAHDEIPNILSKAKIVLTSQPNNVRTKGGFATKIGEYLASGTPTLVSDVGDVSRYFTHSVELYMVPPGDKVLYAQELVYMLLHYNEALHVAVSGQNKIFSEFNAKSMTAKLIRFLGTLA